MPKIELKVYLKTLRRGVKHADIDALMQYIPDQPQLACISYFKRQFASVPHHRQGFERPRAFFHESEMRFCKHVPPIMD
jgi:hypothetical protein